jgi:chromosome segregation protein
MFLKSLELHGFKSFADRTKLEFDEGVTGIVGPNGCGKSNVVDAIRWVLGETSAKALRGGEMADVIFNGTDKRQPLGMAEVTLTLGGCEDQLEGGFSEVALGRRVYRDGKSEYLLNQRPCRLRDIHDLLMDTGIGRTSYSIMEQGKIDQLLSSKPEDRRAVFEEAAGITKFKRDKKEALRKLDYTEANLLRHTDIIEEVERQMRSLQRQAGKARRFQALHTDVKVLDLHLSHRHFRQFRAEHGELINSISSLRQQQDQLEQIVEQRLESVTTAREAHQLIESRINEIRSDLNEQRSTIQAATSRIEFNTERIHEHDMLIRQHEEEIAGVTSKLTEQEQDIRNADLTLASIDEKIAQQNEQLERHEAATHEARAERQRLANELTEVRRQRNEAEGQIATQQARIENCNRQLESDQQRFIQLNEELLRLQNELDEKQTELARLSAELDQRRSKIAEFEEELASFEKSHQETRTEFDSVQSELGEFQRLHSEKTSRLDLLRQLVAEGEGFEEGTKAVLAGLDNPDHFKHSVRGALASLLDVEAGYEVAIEAALGQHLQTIVVEDTRIAEQMLDTLRRDRLGKASLVPGDVVSQPSERQLMSIPDRCSGWALDRVECDEQVRALIDQLLNDILIVDDLKTALELRSEHPGIGFVTLYGEVVTREGIVHGGASTDSQPAGVDGEVSVGGSVLQRQADIRELDALSTELATQLESAEERRASLGGRVAQLEEQLADARRTVQQAKIEFSTLEGQHTLVAKEVQQLEGKLESQRYEQSEVALRQDTLDEELSVAKAGSQQASETLESCAERIEEMRHQLELAEQKESESHERLSEIRTAIAVERRAREAVEQQRTPMTSRIEELRELSTRRTGEIESYRHRIENAGNESIELQQKIETAEARRAELEASMEGIQAEREEASKLIEEGEAELGKARSEIQTVAEQRGKEEVKSTQIELRLESLESATRERYQTDLDRFEPDSHELLAVIENQRKTTDRNAKRQANVEADEEGSEESPPETEAVASTNEEEIEDIDFVDAAEPDWAFVEEIVGGLRAKLDAMGPVNLDAIVEFEELEERHKFLREQHDDLVNSKANLLKVIADINRESRRLFSETFDKVKVNFRDMFKELFGPKAKADLILLDDDDPLECGIDVIAKPPGKTLQSITLLSGGERSMTAVALLFAIYMVKPSPFCVLDELDAPLDESNIGRFIKVLDRFIDDSQFIIVTHSKRTMSRADVMYGVSMQEFGVSKTVGMQFSKEKRDHAPVDPNATTKAKPKTKENTEIETESAST